MANMVEFAARRGPARWRVRRATRRDAAWLGRVENGHPGSGGVADGCGGSSWITADAASLGGQADLVIVCRDGTPVGFCGMAVHQPVNPTAVPVSDPEVRLILWLADGLDEIDAAEAVHRLTRAMAAKVCGP